MVNLRIKNLSARYETSRGPVHAAEDIDLELTDGKSVGIAGESACGKSTLGLSIIRMLHGGNAKGTILFDDASLLDMPESDFGQEYRWKKISVIFQGAMNSLDPVFTVKEQFAEVLGQHGFDGDQNRAISDAVRSVGLDVAVLKKYPHELSGGMKQRVVIGMALLLRPSFVIADEPTTALDVLVQAQIINLLKDLKKQGMSFMLITHDLAVLSEISDMVGVMYGGELVEYGTLSDVYRSPKHPYTRGLLSSIPTLRGKKPSYIKGVPPSLLGPPTECRFLDRCPDAMEKCKQRPPKFPTDTGYVRCWLYEDD